MDAIYTLTVPDASDTAAVLLLLSGLFDLVG